VDVRIESPTLRAQPALGAAEVALALAGRLRAVADRKFGYLSWVVLDAAASQDLPRVVLRIFDGPEPACGTPAVRFRISAEMGGQEAWRRLESDLSEPCDLGVIEMSPAVLVDRIMRVVEASFEEPQTFSEIQGQLLSKVAIAASLEPNPGAQELYLPIRGLKAGEGSELVARFGNRNDRFLSMFPVATLGERTLVHLGRFSCDSIEWATEGAPAKWPARLPELLASCTDPKIYMRVYKSDPLADRVVDDIRTDLGDDEEGGEP
jgi:hypothetical protein